LVQQLPQLGYTVKVDANGFTVGAAEEEAGEHGEAEQDAEHGEAGAAREDQELGQNIFLHFWCGSKQKLFCFIL